MDTGNQNLEKQSTPSVTKYVALLITTWSLVAFMQSNKCWRSRQGELTINSVRELTHCHCQSTQNCSKGMLCVKGACECPILISGPSCGIKARGLKEGCMTSMMDPLMDTYMLKLGLPLLNHSERMQATWKNGTHHLQELGNTESCAVVGSAESLIQGTRYGKEIDQHGTVIRFNDAPTLGYEEHVGSKTTLRIQNSIYCGFTEKPGELCMRYTARHNRSSDWSSDVMKGHIQPETDCRNWSGCIPVQGNSYTAVYAMAYWNLSFPDKSSKHKTQRKLSAGFFAIALSLHICGQVDVYGIEGGELHYYVKNIIEGHNEGPCTLAGCKNKRSFKQRHSWNSEKKCFLHLKKGILPRLSFRS